MSIMSNENENEDFVIDWAAEAGLANTQVFDVYDYDDQPVDHDQFTLQLLEAFGDNTSKVFSNPAFVTGYVAGLVSARDTAKDPSYVCGRAIPDDRDPFDVIGALAMSGNLQLAINATVDLFTLYNELA